MMANKANVIPAPVSNMNVVSFDQIQSLMVGLKNDLLSSFRVDLQNVMNQLETINNRCFGLEKKIENIYHLQQKQQAEIDKLKATVNNLDLSRSQILNEVEDRETRRNKVVIFGLPEMSASVEERFEFDEEQVYNILTELDETDYRITEIRRLGHANVRGKLSRPLKVSLSNRDSAQNILQKSRQLKNSSRFQNVYISKDKTKKQQREWRELREELERRKTVDEDAIIYRGKVCSRSELHGKKNFRM